MAKRITVMLDETFLKKLHDIQARNIREKKESVSFSKTVNDTLREALK